MRMKCKVLDVKRINNQRGGFFFEDVSVERNMNHTIRDKVFVDKAFAPKVVEENSKKGEEEVHIPVTDAWVWWHAMKIWE